MKNLARAIPSFTLALCIVQALPGANGSAATPATPADLGWPRQYTDGTAKLVLHQPQVDAWTDFKKLEARLVTSLTTSKNAQPVLGTLSIEFETVVDLDSRTVACHNFHVVEMTYPSAKDETEAKAWPGVEATKLLPPYPTSLALDRILAYMDKSQSNARQTEVLLDPPSILVSTQPAVLVITDGKPIPLDIEKTNLQKIVNTNWDLFFDKKENRYYLRDDKVWLSAKTLTDAWTAVTKLPKDFTKLPATDQYKEVLQTAAKPHKPSGIKLVLVVDKPSELVVLAGEPIFTPIADTHLMWVNNTECDLFFDSAGNQFYFLTSGRWFRSPELKSNQWVATTTSLPEDFKKIPLDHPRAHVLAAVPGTRQAEEAVLNASIPQIATVSRKSAKAEVQYVGDPKFEPINDTGVSYAVNTPNDVFRFQDQYYLCLDGVWFVAKDARAPGRQPIKFPRNSIRSLRIRPSITSLM